MKPPDTSADEAQTNGQALRRNRLEVIRFASQEDCRRAIGALLEYGMLNFTSHREEEWLVYTPVARALRQLGVPFEWLTENV
jgi:hypothetical protein